MLFLDPHTDFTNVLRFANDYSKNIGIPYLDIDARCVKGIIAGAESDGDYVAAKASPFKKLAAFIAYFVSEKPITPTFYIEKFKNIENHQNAIFAFEIAIDSLHGAKIHLGSCVFVLENRIEVSDHSYVDIIDAIAFVTPQSGKKLVAVLLEQMCYRQNPDCKY